MNEIAARARAAAGPDQSAEPLWIEVIYTSRRKTLIALRRALQLAKELEAEIVLRRTVVISYTLPLEADAARRRALVVEMKSLLRRCQPAQGETARAELVICRDRRRALAATIAPGALVLMGHGGALSGSGRLARALRRQGHQVLKIGSGEGNNARRVLHPGGVRGDRGAVGIYARLRKALGGGHGIYDRRRGGGGDFRLPDLRAVAAGKVLGGSR